MFGKRIKLFTLSGFEVKIDASWLILAALIVWSLARGLFPYEFPGLSQPAYWWMAAGGALGLFVSIVVHEFAHSVVARRYGIPMKGITLFIFGGVAEMDSEPPSAKAEFRMAVVGPLTSFVLAGVFYVAAVAARAVGAGVPPRVVLSYLAWINAVLAVFNLIPAFPLDGGRVLRAYLWNRKNDIRGATRTASRIGEVFGAVLMFLGLMQVIFGNFIGGVWWFLIGMFLRNASQMAYRQLEIRQALEGEPVSRFMKREPVTVPCDISLSEMVDGYVYRHYHDVFPVLDHGRLVGCVGVSQLKQVPRDEWPVHHVEEVMQPCTPANTVSSDTDAVKALAIMNKTGNSRLMVVDGDRLVGVVTLKDLLRFLSLKLDLEGGEIPVHEETRLVHRIS